MHENGTMFKNCKKIKVIRFQHGLLMKLLKFEF